MGDEVLRVSKYILIFTCTSILAFANNNALNKKIKVFDNIFESINKKRFGLSDKAISETKNPFEIKSKDKADKSALEESEKEKYQLFALLGKRAKINKKWYSLQDKIGTYTLINITKSSVTLKSVNDTIELKLHRGSKNVNISIK